MNGMPSALRGIHRQGVRNRNDILLLSVVYSLSYEAEDIGIIYGFEISSNPDVGASRCFSRQTEARPASD